MRKRSSRWAIGSPTSSSWPNPFSPSPRSSALVWRVRNWSTRSRGICAAFCAATRAPIWLSGSAMNSRRTVEPGESAAGVPDADVGAALGYSRPGSYEELRAVLSSGTARLPKKLRQVAIHLWQHPTAVALGTVTSVADEAGVQPSTLVRFAQAFGYSGFSDLQEAFKAHLADGGRSRDRWESASSSEAARLVDGFIGSAPAAAPPARGRVAPGQLQKT